MFQVIAAPQVLRSNIDDSDEAVAATTPSKAPLTAVFPAAALPPASLVQSDGPKAATSRSPKKSSVGASTLSSPSVSIAGVGKAAGGTNPFGKLWCSVQVYEVSDASPANPGAIAGDSAAAESACQTKAVRDSLLQQLPPSLPVATPPASSFALNSGGSAVTSSVSTTSSSSSSSSLSSSSTTAPAASLLHREDLSGGLPVACAGLPKRGHNCRSADVAELIRAVGPPSATSLVPIEHPLLEAPGQNGSRSNHSNGSISSSHHSAPKSGNGASNSTHNSKKGPREWIPLLLAPPLGSMTAATAATTAATTTVPPRAPLLPITVRLVVRLALAPPPPCRLGEACLGGALLSKHRFNEKARTKQKNLSSKQQHNQEAQDQELEKEQPQQASPIPGELRLNGARNVAHEQSSNLSDHFRVAPGPPVALVLFHLTYQAKTRKSDTPSIGNSDNGSSSSNGYGNSGKKDNAAGVPDNAFVQVEARRSLTCPFCLPQSSSTSGRSRCAPEPSPEALLQHLWSHHGEHLEFTGRRDRRDMRVFHVAVQRNFNVGMGKFCSSPAGSEAADVDVPVSSDNVKKVAKGRKELATAASTKRVEAASLGAAKSTPLSYQLWSTRGIVRRATRAQRIILQSSQRAANAAGEGSRGKNANGSSSNGKEKRSAAVAAAAASNGPNKRAKTESSNGNGMSTAATTVHGNVAKSSTSGGTEAAAAVPLTPAIAEAANAAVSAASARLCEGTIAPTTQRGKGTALLPVRQYYHSRTGVPMLPHEMDDDSDGDIDDDWAVIMYKVTSVCLMILRLRFSATWGHCFLFDALYSSCTPS